AGLHEDGRKVARGPVSKHGRGRDSPRGTLSHEGGNPDHSHLGPGTAEILVDRNVLASGQNGKFAKNLLRHLIRISPEPKHSHAGRTVLNRYIPVAGAAVPAAAFSNDRPPTALGTPGGLNENRFPAASTVILPTRGGPVSCARVRIWS